MLSDVGRPPLKYPGGKWRSAPWIIEHFPAHRVYVEPFGGGASVLLRKERSRLEVYNDMAGHVVNVFRVLQDAEKATRLRELIQLTPYARAEFELAFDECEDDVEDARRTILRSHFGFGSSGVRRRHTGLRTKDHRDYGNSIAMQWLIYPEFIEQFTERLRGVVIENRDAFELIEYQDSKDTLFYLDPPYVMDTRNDNERRYQFELSDDDHRALAELVRDIDGMVAISGYDGELYRELFGDWRWVSKMVTVQSKSGGIARPESLWLSPNCRQRQRSFW